MHLEIIRNATIDGNLVRLPEGQLDRKVYESVAKCLNLIGGKWKGGKVAAFVFDSDPTAKIAAVLGGEKIVSAKKEFQFFATPDKWADKLVEMAEIEKFDRICEPSAGQGAIVKAILRYFASQSRVLDHISNPISCFELMEVNRNILAEIKEARVLGDDFIAEAQFWGGYSVIIANPPFTKNQDIDHVMMMLKHLLPGGRLVTIMSNHWRHCDGHRKEREFRNLMDIMNAKITEIPAGEFKESGTNVSACIVKIVKAKE